MLRQATARVFSTSAPKVSLRPPLRRKMSSHNVSPFTTAVVSSMRRLYPEALADKTFDNTGLLLEAPFISSRPRNRNSVLLTVDLTRAVAEEAIENNHSVVVAYHPIIFRPLKSITAGDTQQLSMTRLLAHGISVYCPHTAVDTVPGGMADWLCDIVTGKLEDPEPRAYSAESPASETDVTTSTSSSEAPSKPSTRPTTPPSKADKDSGAMSDDPFITPKAKMRLARPDHAHRKYSKPGLPVPTDTFHAAVISHSRSVITPSPRAGIDQANQYTSSDLYNSSNTGAGRLIEFATPQPLTLLITRIAHAIGLPKGFAVAIPQGQDLGTIKISSVATCPGSGGGVIRGTTADLIFTGELSHHEALAVIERGGCVISLFHSNSERGYLWNVMHDRLEKEVVEEWQKMRNEESGKSGLGEQIREMLGDETVEVVMSERDRDPYGIVVLDETAVEGQKINGSAG
jgi:dinuclear metal center YbgI/SA1388 family protein